MSRFLSDQIVGSSRRAIRETSSTTQGEQDSKSCATHLGSVECVGREDSGGQGAEWHHGLTGTQRVNGCSEHEKRGATYSRTTSNHFLGTVARLKRARCRRR